MKIKEDIIKWREEIRKLAKQSEIVLKDTNAFHEDVKDLKEQVSKLVKITEEMTEAMLTLIRQQIGD